MHAVSHSQLYEQICRTVSRKTIRLEYSLTINYEIDSLPNLQIQATNIDKAKWIQRFG
jgi:hypothetical protein